MKSTFERHNQHVINEKHLSWALTYRTLSPSSTGNLIFGLLISGISSCLTSLNFWTTILNLRSYYLTLKTMPLFPWALLITGGMLLLTLPILSGALLQSYKISFLRSGWQVPKRNRISVKFIFLFTNMDRPLVTMCFSFIIYFYLHSDHCC